MRQHQTGIEVAAFTDQPQRAEDLAALWGIKARESVS
jgi:hypothetical protein